MFRRRIYLDHASLTPIDRHVIAEMVKMSLPKFANPSAWYKEGVSAKEVMGRSRDMVASFLHAHADEIVFTSGGTEANNLAIQGAFRVAHDKYMEGGANSEKPHLIISSIEHSSIIETANMLERLGCEVTRLSVDRNGVVDLDELKRSIRAGTFLVSIMTVNNEIGTVQPIREIAKIIRRARGGDPKHRSVGQPVDERVGRYPLFHTDASQAVLYNDLNVEKLGVDMLTIDGSKVYGPRGIGALYIRRNTPIRSILGGGGQESRLRSGTENIPAIAGLAKALQIITNDRMVNGRVPEVTSGSYMKMRMLREMMIRGLKDILPNISVNGIIEGDNYSPHILNVSIPNIDNEFFVLQLDANGIACSTKSSCLTDEDESYVLRAIGANSRESIRFSFGRRTKKRDIKKTLKIIKMLIGRKMSSG